MRTKTQLNEAIADTVEPPKEKIKLRTFAKANPLKGSFTDTKSSLESGEKTPEKIERKSTVTPEKTSERIKTFA